MGRVRTVKKTTAEFNALLAKDSDTLYFVSPNASFDPQQMSFDPEGEIWLGGTRLTPLPCAWDDITAKPLATQVISFNPAGQLTAGWRRLCTLKREGTYLLLTQGVYTERPMATCGFAISVHYVGASIRQLWGQPSGLSSSLTKLRLVRRKVDGAFESGQKWYLDAYHEAYTGTNRTGIRRFVLVGSAIQSNPISDVLGDFHTLTETTPPEGSTVSEATVRVMKDRPSIKINLNSEAAGYYDGTDITPGVTGTLPIAHGGTGQTTKDGIVNEFVQGPVDTATKVFHASKSDLGGEFPQIIYKGNSIRRLFSTDINDPGIYKVFAFLTITTNPGAAVTEVSVGLYGGYCAPSDLASQESLRETRTRLVGASYATVYLEGLIGVSAADESKRVYFGYAVKNHGTQSSPSSDYIKLVGDTSSPIRACSVGVYRIGTYVGGGNTPTSDTDGTFTPKV